MRRLRGVIFNVVTIVFCVVLSACNSQGGIGEMGSDQTLGAGAVGGGLTGYAITGGPAAVVIGAKAGGLIGDRLSDALKGDEQMAAAEAAARAAESNIGQVVTWRKTDALWQTEAQGTATPRGSFFTDSGGRTCRFVYQTMIKNGQQISDAVRLCKGSSGWVPA